MDRVGYALLRFGGTLFFVYGVLFFMVIAASGEFETGPTYWLQRLYLASTDVFWHAGLARGLAGALFLAGGVAAICVAYRSLTKPLLLIAAFYLGGLCIRFATISTFPLAFVKFPAIAIFVGLFGLFLVIQISREDPEG